MKTPGDRGETGSELGKIVRHAGKDATKAPSAQVFPFPNGRRRVVKSAFAQVLTFSNAEGVVAQLFR
jgi:hypothetical protein